MRRIKVKDNQTLFDISIQEYGTIRNVIALAKLNNLSITDGLIINQELLIDDFPNEQSVLKYYSENSIIPATAQLTDEIETLVFDELIDGGQTPPVYEYDPTFSDEF